MTELRVWRAHERDRATAFQLVGEYNEAVDVVLRDAMRTLYRGLGAETRSATERKARRPIRACLWRLQLNPCARSERSIIKWRVLYG